MSVGKICSRELVTADGNDAVSTAAQRMEEHCVGCLVVVDDAQRPLGLLTDRDLAVRGSAQPCPPSRLKVWELMNPLPQCVAEDASIDEALTIMRAGPYRRLPVIDRDGRAVGLVSIDDILKHVAKEIEEISRLLSIHGDQSQNRRLETESRVRTGDVAAR